MATIDTPLVDDHGPPAGAVVDTASAPRDAAVVIDHVATPAAIEPVPRPVQTLRREILAIGTRAGVKRRVAIERNPLASDHAQFADTAFRRTTLDWSGASRGPARVRLARLASDLSRASLA